VGISRAGLHQFSERVHDGFIHIGYVDELPDDASVSSWA
jgi:hypothetical protein